MSLFFFLSLSFFSFGVGGVRKDGIPKASFVVVECFGGHLDECVTKAAETRLNALQKTAAAMSEAPITLDANGTFIVLSILRWSTYYLLQLQHNYNNKQQSKCDRGEGYF